MFFLISFLWFIRETKAILFWLYLWQLKEYRLDRLLDHFRTEKGRRLIFNLLNFLKLLSIFSIFFVFGLGFLVKIELTFFSFLFSLLILFLYSGEAFKTAKDFFEKKIKIPLLTKKIIFLISFGILIEILFVFILYQSQQYISVLAGQIADFLPLLGLILFDIFTPLITSAFVFFFQPLAILWKNQIIKKAKKQRAKFKDLLVIGITGSYGKTSTKEFLATILSEKFNVLKTKEHQNTEIGVSQCILNDLKPEHEIFIVEMGAYKKGEIKLLCDIVRPKIGIVTGVNEQHLALFGSMENLILAEGGKELIESLPEEGMVFLNGKNEFCRKIYQEIKMKKFLYGEKAQLLMENIEGAKTVARELGLTEEEILKGCQKIKNFLPGMEMKKGVNGLTIIDATYSANPDGVIAHLEYLKNFSGRKIIVMPCLIELGSASKGVHKRIGQKIAQICDLAIITTKDRFKEIKKEVSEKAIFLEEPKEILDKIKNFCQPGDVVLLEGRVPSQLISQLIIE